MASLTIFGIEAPIFEIGMLLCFGIAWPISIIKQIKSKSTGGKSVIFSFVVLFGYICGILNNVLSNIEGNVFTITLAFPFYILNLITVSIDTAMWFRNRKLEKARGLR